MKIQISKQTPLAMSPDAVCMAINRHTEHQAFMSNERDTDADVIMFNNTFWMTDKPAVIQYHSEPHWKGLQRDCPYKKLVNAQYHALLPEYSDCTPVRQVINFDTPQYNMLDINELKIGYSPTSRVKVGAWHDKGYERTVAILKRLESEHGIKHDIIEGVSIDECIARKQRCSIILDECVTGSYHRSGLEGLALGKPTISWLSDDVTTLFSNVAGVCARPFFSVNIDGLEAGILRLIDGMQRATTMHSIGFNNRFWMFRYWNPVDVVQEYIKAYEEVISAKQ